MNKNNNDSQNTTEYNYIITPIHGNSEPQTK